MERLMCNFHYLGYSCSPNLSIHQNRTQEPTWNFLVTLAKLLLCWPCACFNRNQNNRTVFYFKILGQTSPLPSSITHHQQQQVQHTPVHHPATINNHHHTTTNVLSTMRSLNEKSRNLSKAKINTSKLLTPLDPNKLKLKLTIDSKFKETVHHANKTTTDLTATAKSPPR